jgi:hypothetical protein
VPKPIPEMEPMEAWHRGYKDACFTIVQLLMGAGQERLARILAKHFKVKLRA